MRQKLERFALIHVLSRLPDRALVRIAGGKPVVLEGRTLNPLFQAMMYFNRTPKMERLPPAAARRVLARLVQVTQADELPMANVREESVPVEGGSIRVRCLTPPGLGARSPGIVWFHGGGHVIGDIDDSDRTVRYVATRTGCRLVNVEYRCAPEHKFPTPVEDCIAAYRWVLDNAGRLGLDPSRLAVMGDSAGGNLAAVVSLAARDRGFALPAVQCLIYPVVDLRQLSKSLTTFATGFGLTKPLIEWFARHYIRSDADRSDPLASPLLAESHAGLPPAIVTVAGFDPLHDEGVAYADKLKDAGVPVTLLRHDDLTHAWVTMTATPPGRAAMDETCALVRRALSS